MSAEIKSFILFDMRSFFAKGVVIFALIFLIFVGWIGIRMQLGSMIGEMTPLTDPNAKANGLTAVYLAPNDPVANWLLLNAEKNSRANSPEKDNSVNFESVVRLSPNDFHYWLELGRNYEHANDIEAAEKAFRKSLELAPNYSFPLWTYGNFLLRQGRTEEAFQQLKKSANGSALYREQVFFTAWEVYEKDTAKLEAIAGEGAGAKAYLARFYTKQDMPEKALESWSVLNADEKQTYRQIGADIKQSLFDRRDFRTSLEFAHQLDLEAGAKKEFVSNGNFENPVGENKLNLFDWKVVPLEKFDVKRDGSQKHEGKWSLRIGFNGYKGITLANVFQIVAAEPGTKYRLSFWLRTSELKSSGLPLIEIIDAKTDKGIAVTSSFPAGSNDWQEVRIDFAMPKDSDGFIIRTARNFCGENCPITGSIWYDDFKLEQIGR